VLQQDLADLVRKAWEKHGVTPGDLFERLTPSQFAAVFTRRSGSSGFDRVEEITKLNRERGLRGLRPIIPSWL
jgi:hypothetical protein